MADRGRRTTNDDPLLLDGARRVGTIRRLMADRGFGFVKLDDGDEIFVHRRASFKNPEGFDGLVEGVTRVTCQTRQGAKGYYAADVQLAESGQ